MSTMIERVARAIWSVRREEEDRCDMELEDVGDDHSVWAEARTAIEEMRKPTAGMRRAVGDIGGPQALAYAIAAWPTMIDAALKE
ncbi:hypothetical protein GOL82_30645 [Sinorhizobium medicae]|nr:hypothetical protein [Sinorhizobium medicae]